MHLPYFATDLEHEQTIILQKKYQKQRQFISQHYKNGDFLELTLLRLME